MNAPARALRLTLEIQANTIPELLDELLDLVGSLHELKVAGLPPRWDVMRGHAGTDVNASLRCDMSMTPERYRQERALHNQTVNVSRFIRAEGIVSDVPQVAIIHGPETVRPLDRETFVDAYRLPARKENS